MSTVACQVATPPTLWSPAETLSPRVRQLRDQYWDFYHRDYANEVRSFTSGASWDQVYAPWNWTNAPEMMMFFEGAKAYLLADATEVKLPPGFWEQPLVVRRAIFFKRVSVGRLGMETAPNGASHTMSFSPSLLKSDENHRKMVALLRAYGQVGGACLQVNVVSPETQRAAQQDPDAYRNLLVRITGYNAYFVMLGTEIQNEIIARESHAL